MTKIQKLQHDIFIYKKRYAANQISYKKRQQALREKIKSWENRLKIEISQRDKLKKIYKGVKFQDSIDIRKQKKKKNNDLKDCVYKVALEGNINSRQIGDYFQVGRSIALIGRKRVTKKFNDSEKKAIYNNIKKYVE